MTRESTTPLDHGSVLHLDSVSKHYAGVPAVDGIDLEVKTGEFLTLLGPSGSGKTTTLSMIAGFGNPTSGRIVFGGKDITATPPHRRNMGMVFQNYSLFPHLSVGANVEFPLRQRGFPKVERRRLANNALEAVELSHRSEAMPDQLSGGQQQRVALARALVFEPSLLLMDEPFGALDRGLRERMQLEVRRIHQKLGVTILFVTHDQQEALTMSDRIAVFNKGRIEQLGTPEDLYDRPDSEFVATFLGESTVIRGDVSGGVLSVPGEPSIPVTSSVPEGATTVVLRPEMLRLNSVNASGPGLIGQVEDVVYLGADRRVDVITPAGPVMLRLAADVIAPRAGESVRVSWNAKDAHYFGREPAGLASPSSLETPRKE